MAKKHQASCPSNISLLKTYHKLVDNETIEPSPQIEKLLRTRPVRSLSGIVNVSVLTKPYPCPGECIYCPYQEGTPKSYLKGEPAVMRAELSDYDPHQQVEGRIKSLQKEGHPTDKIELRIIGGTWSYYPHQYQNYFIKKCFEAANGESSSSLNRAQQQNENADHRIIGLSIETRPDFIDKKEIRHLRNLGITRVEIGVQTLSDKILNLVKRGHTVQDTAKATKLLKNAGFKVCYQMMPNLPGSSIEQDNQMFKDLFSDSKFQPDLLKIYPTVLLKQAPLYQWYRQGKYQPYSKNQLIKLLKSIKKDIPYYCRIQRIIRDIPTDQIVAGCKVSNLRQIIHQQMREEKWQCNCIRCREVRNHYGPKEKLKLFRENYKASKGKEVFLSLETPNRKLYALLRLRVPTYIFEKKKHFIPVLNNSAIIREVHTYGQMVPIAGNKLAPQHKGLGKKLIKQAERIARQEFGLEKMVVISAVGARNYFRKLGYELKDTYMIKEL